MSQSLVCRFGLGFNFLWTQVIKSDSAVSCYLICLFFAYCQREILFQDLSNQIVIWVLCSPRIVEFLNLNRFQLVLSDVLYAYRYVHKQYSFVLKVNTIHRQQIERLSKSFFCPVVIYGCNFSIRNMKYSPILGSVFCQEF